MSFKSLYSIKKETDVTQGITPLKCETSLGHSETFRNVCKAPSVGDAALCWCWFKAGAQDPTLPSTRAVFAGHAPLPGGADVFVHRSQDDNMSCRELASVPLCLSLASVTSQVYPSPAVLLRPCETITAGCAKYFPRFCPGLPPATSHWS